ncbi:MBL fold metallo-hydrolase [Chloroflexota bacterium]
MVKKIFQKGNLNISRLTLGQWRTHAYLLVDDASNESVLVDAPDEPEKLVSAIGSTRLKYILITHRHRDHVLALESIQDKYPDVPVACSEDDASMLRGTPSIILTDGSRLEFGNHNIEVLHTPGHTAGSVCFYVNDVLLVGDTIFPGGPGRTRTAIEFLQIVKSAKKIFSSLPGETIILPGHGNSTTLAKEKAAFEAFSAIERPADLFGNIQWLRY